MENLKKEVTRSELDGGMPLNNMCLCKVYYSNKDVKTKSGVIVGFLNEETFASEDGKDTSSHIADVAEISLIIHRTPESLYFNPEDPKGMDWETEMELGQEDIIWTNPIDALNAVTLTCEGKEYKLISYADIYCYKREIWVDKWSVPQKKKTISRTINGYVLIEAVNRPKISDLDISSGNKQYKDRGIVRYLGTPNIRHRSPEVTDFQDLQEGDLVLFDRKCTPFLLERVSYASKFSETPLWVVPRKYIDLILKKD